MNPRDPNVQSVEAVAQALGDLCDALVLVGGCAAGLLCTSPNAPPPRVTYDVDVVAEVAALADYYALEQQFAARGFVRDVAQDAPVCRWRLGELCVDLMPSEERILGFANRWYPLVSAGDRGRIACGVAQWTADSPDFGAGLYGDEAGGFCDARQGRSAVQPRFRGHHPCY